MLNFFGRDCFEQLGGLEGLALLRGGHNDAITILDLRHHAVNAILRWSDVV
jgi:hypothetical protein